MKSYQIGKQKFTEDKLKNMSGTDANALYYATHQGNKKANTMAFNPGSYVEPDIKTEPTKEEKDQLLRQIQQIRKNMNEPKSVPVLNKPEAKKTVSYVSQKQKDQANKNKYAFKKGLEEVGNNPMLNGSTSFSSVNNVIDYPNSDKGKYGLGNIDLTNRPQYKNEDGSVSTVRSMSFNEDGKEILVPTIDYDQYGNPVLLSDEEAIDRYHRTGEYLGKFDTVKQANEYAENLHRQQEDLYSDEAFIQRVLDPSYKMTKEEKKRAQEIVSNYEREHANDANPNATELVFDEEHPDGYMKPLAELSDEEKAEQENIYALRDKISKGESALMGATRTTPGVKALLKRDNTGYWDRADANAQKQNPLAYYAGLFGNGVLMNNAARYLLNGTGWGNTIDNLFGTNKEGISEGSRVARQILSDTMKDAPVDLATDILPELGYDIASGKSAGDVAKSTLFNTTVNGGLNAVSAGLGNLDDILDLYRLNRSTKENLRNLEDIILRNTDEAPVMPKIRDDIDLDNIDWGKFIDENAIQNREYLKKIEQDILNSTDEVPTVPMLQKNIDVDNIRWGLGEETADPNNLLKEREALIESLNAKGTSMQEMLEKNRQIKELDELIAEQRPELYRDGRFVGENYKTVDLYNEGDIVDAKPITMDDIHIKTTKGKNKKYYATFGDDDTPLFTEESSVKASADDIEKAGFVDDSDDIRVVPQKFDSEEDLRKAIDDFLKKQPSAEPITESAEQVTKSIETPEVLKTKRSELNNELDNMLDVVARTNSNSDLAFNDKIRDLQNLAHLVEKMKNSTDYENGMQLVRLDGYNSPHINLLNDVAIKQSDNLGLNSLETEEADRIIDIFRKEYNKAFTAKGNVKKNYLTSVDETPVNSVAKEAELPETNKVVAESKPSNPTLTEEVKPEVKSTKDTADKVVDNIVEEAKKDAENGSNQKVSKAYTNTGKEGGGWNKTEYNKYTDPKNYTYDDVSEVESVNEATRMRDTEGREAFKERVLNKANISGAEVDGLMMEWRETIERARELEKQGIDASALWAESNRIFRKIQTEETYNAQALQALAKWSRNTPEGLLMKAEQMVNKRVQKLKPEKSEAQKVLDKLLKKHKDIEFSEQFQKKFLEEAENVFEMSDMDSRQAKQAMAKLGQMVNDEIPVKLPEKVTAYLMDSMLGNFRTLITRNAGGNVGLNAVEQTIQRPLAAALDKLVATKTGVRTQAGLTKDGLIEYMSGFRKGLADEWNDIKTGLHTSRTGENTLENAINANRHVFKNGLLNKFDSYVKNGLSVGDRPFYEAVYNQTLGDYKRLRSTGQMGEAINNLSDEDFAMYAEAAAKMNALMAVYQNDSKFAKALLSLKKGIGELSEGTIGVDVLSQFSMPFVKTPANVVDRAIDYSPLGLVRNAIRTSKEGGIGGADFNQNRFVNELSRNIIGTGLMGGAAVGANAGLMSGSYSDNSEEKQAQKRSGMQEYALRIPELVNGTGEHQMDISWLPVVGSNAVAAAAAVDAYEKGEGNVAQNIGAGLKEGGEALFNQSMFQGLQRLFGSNNSYDNEQGIVANAINTVKQGLGQAIPSLARQMGQVIDPYQRDVSNSNNGNYDLNSIINNTPIARQFLLAPKVGDNGELMMENQGRGIGSKILENMILPGKITEVKENPLDVEAKRLSDETGNTVAYRPRAMRKDVDTDEHKLTNDEWVQYEQNLERATTEIGNSIINSDYYKTATDPDRERLLDNAYADVKNAIKSDYNGKEIDGGAKVYKEAGGGEAGIKALTDYYAEKAYAKEVKNAMGSNSEWATALYESGDEDRIQRYNEAREIAQEYDVNLTENNFLRYEKDGKWGLKQELYYGKKAKDIGIDAGGNKQFRKLVDGGVDDRRIKNAYDDITSVVTGKDEFDRDTHLSFNEKSYDIWDKYGKQGLEDYAKISAAKANFNTYRQAKKSYPSMTVDKYISVFNSLDGNTGSDPDGKIGQGELINYYNSHNVDEKEVKKMWEAYGEHSGDNAWKKVPVLKYNKKTGKNEWTTVKK